MRLAFTLLLGGAAGRFLAFRPVKVAAISSFAFIFGAAGFFERDGNCLAPVLHLAASSAGAALEFAVLEFVHDPARYAPLPR